MTIAPPATLTAGDDVSRAAPPATRDRGLAPVAAFFALAYAFSWTLWLPLVLDDDIVRRGDGWPTHIPGLLGPSLAALVVLSRTEGRTAVRRWLAAMVRLPRERHQQLAAIAPLGFMAVGLALATALGNLPPARDFISFSGVAANPAVFALAMLVGALGEEAGWRGYALPRLQHGLGPLRATLVLALLWALWHTPLFFVLDSYRGFGPLTAVGFLIGLTAGALVLTSLYNHTGGSILAVAVWHASYNLSSATAAADGAMAAIATALVIFGAISILQRQRAGIPALRPPAPRATDPPHRFRQAPPSSPPPSAERETAARSMIEGRRTDSAAVPPDA